MNGINKRTKLIIVLLCSIGGILILIGSTYAFFNYFRRGEVNNRFITGSLSIDFIDGEFLKLTDQFPTSDEKARFLGDSEINPVNDGDITIASFVVKGTASEELPYSVFGIFDSEDEVYSDTDYRLLDSQIKLYLESNNPDMVNSSIVPNSGIDTNVYTGTGNYGSTEFGAYGSKISSLIYPEDYRLLDPDNEFSERIPLSTTEGGRVLLAEGTFSGGAEISHVYTMHMWIAGDVTLSDVDENADYCASAKFCLYSTGIEAKKIFDKMYYTLKIKVESNK